MTQPNHVSESSFGEFLESVPDAMTLVDSRGVIVAGNAQLEKLFGYGRGELIGQKIEVLIPARFGHGHVKRRDTYLEKPNQRPMGLGMHLSGSRKDGTEFPVEISLGPVRINEEKYVSAAVRDVTERLRIEKLVDAKKEQLYHAQKLEALGSLVAGVAHDFNNLVFAIQSSAELARLSLTGSGPAADALERIQEAADQAKGVTKSLLTFTHKGAAVKEPTELSQIIRAASRLIKDILPARVQLNIDMPTKAIWVNGDVTQILQVLLNLSINARDAMPAGGNLGIRVTTESGDKHFAILEVSDDGDGIDERVLARIFEPYFTTKDKESGTGLGLAISQGIIEDHGGELSVQSTLGDGTTFSIRLPRLLEMQTVGFVEPLPGSSEFHTGVALLAEDNELVRGAIAGMLEILGYEVITAGDGRAAIRRFEENRESIDLLIVDVEMPHVGGGECISTIRAEGGLIAAILVHGGDALLELKDQIKDTPVLHKPFSVDELRQAIEAARSETMSEMG